MASYTRNLNLVKPDNTDLLTRSRQWYNEDMDEIDAAVTELLEALGGVKIVSLSAEEYETTEHDGSTLYIVPPNIYLGELKLGGGSGAAPAGRVKLSLRGAVGTAGTAERTD